MLSAKSAHSVKGWLFSSVVRFGKSTFRGESISSASLRAIGLSRSKIAWACLATVISLSTFKTRKLTKQVACSPEGICVGHKCRGGNEVSHPKTKRTVSKYINSNCLRVSSLLELSNGCCCLLRCVYLLLKSLLVILSFYQMKLN